MSTSTTTAQTTDEPDASNCDRLTLMPEEMLFEVARRLPTLSDLVHFQATSRHVYTISQAKTSWAEVLESFKKPPDDPGERKTVLLTRSTWLSRRLPDFYPPTFIFPNIVAKRILERPLRKSQESRFLTALFSAPQINYLTALLAVQVEPKSNFVLHGGSEAFYLSIDALIKLLSRNPRLQYLSLYDSDTGSGIIKVFHAVAKYCPNLKFLYSESNCAIPDIEIYRLVAACPKLEELAFPNCPRKRTLAKQLGWSFVSEGDHHEYDGSTDPLQPEMSSKFPVVKHYGNQSSEWAVAGRDIMRRPDGWELSSKQVEVIQSLRDPDSSPTSSNPSNNSENWSAWVS